MIILLLGCFFFEGWFGMFCIKLGLASFCVLEWIMYALIWYVLDWVDYIFGINKNTTKFSRLLWITLNLHRFFTRRHIVWLFYAYNLQVKFKITSVYFATRNSFCWFNAFDQNIVAVDEIWAEVAFLSQYLPCWNSFVILKFGWFKTCSYSCI